MEIEGGTPLLARWTTDWDCGHETSWWFIIKDAPFNLSEYSSKQRKHFRQALNKCEVRIVDPVEQSEKLYKVYVAAFQNYKEADNESSHEQFLTNCHKDQQEGVIYFAAFDKVSGMLIGYMNTVEHPTYVETRTAKYHPDFLNLRPSDAIHYTVLDYYLNQLRKKFVCSGSRNINHITNAQEYKIESFKFRRAYCHLHVKFNPKIAWAIPIAYRMRGVLRKFDKIRLIHQINAVLKMEEIQRGK